MKLLIYALMILLPIGASAEISDLPQEIGALKVEDAAIFRLPGEFFYYIDRKNQTCFMVMKKIDSFSVSAGHEGLFGMSGMTNINCDQLRSTPEIDKFLKSGKEM